MRIRTIEPIAVSLPMLKPVIMAGEEVRRADNGSAPLRPS